MRRIGHVTPVLALLPLLAAAPAFGSGTLSGTVRSAQGSPLAGMVVQAWPPGGSVPVVTGTSASGTYTFLLPAGSYRLLAFDPAGAWATDFYSRATSFEGSSVLAVAECTSVSGIDLALAPAGYLSGTVLDATTGQPVSGATVAAYNADGSVRGFTTSSSVGAFTLALPAGSYVLGAWDSRGAYVPTFAPGTDRFEAATPVDVVAGQTTSAGALPLPPAGFVAGRLTDATDGAPLAGLVAELYGTDGTVRATAVSDATGTFLLAAVPGTYRLVGSDPAGKYRTAYLGSSSFATSVPIDVVARQTVGNADLALVPVTASTVEERFVPAVAQSGGVNGTFFTTDLSVLNTSATATARVSLSFLRTGGGENTSPPTVTREIPPGAQLTVVEVLRTLFDTTGAGALRLESDVPIAVTSTTSTPAGALAPGGRFGLGVPGRARTRAMLLGRIPAITVDAALRTNVGVLNPGPAPISIDLELSGSDGGRIAVGSIALGALGQFQASTIASYLGVTSALRNASLRLSSSSPFFAYATVIDQVTGDASYVEAEPD